MNRNFILLTSLQAICVFGCSNIQDTTRPTDVGSSVSDMVDSGRIENRAAAKENDASFVTEISFEPRSALLSAESAVRLRELVRSARLSGNNIDNIKVVSWSDHEYARGRKVNLSSEQKGLANRRGNRIKEYFNQNFEAIDVDTFSMTESPSNLAKWMKTDDFKVKKSFENAGIGTNPSDFPSKAGKSVVMVVLD